MANSGKPLRVRAKELRPRVSGFSIFPPNVEFELPEPGPDEREVIRSLLIYLEDRRVLFAPEAAEVPSHAIHSVNDLRAELTDALRQLDEDSPAVPTLRSMRAACRKFLEGLGPDFAEDRPLSVPRGGYQDWVFWSALGELRGVMGVAIAGLAVRHQLNVNGPLTTILPAAPEQAG